MTLYSCIRQRKLQKILTFWRRDCNQNNMSSNQELLTLDLKKGTYLKDVPEEDENSEDFRSETDATSVSERSPEQKIQLGADETRMVTKSKVIFILVLIFTAAGCATATYLFTQHSNQQAFETAVSSSE